MSGPAIEIDREGGTITVGNFTYSIDLLASGMETAPGWWVRVSINGGTTTLHQATSGRIAAEWFKGNDMARDD